MANIAVSGANGFIGRHLSQLLRGRGHTVQRIERHTDPSRHNEDIKPGYKQLRLGGIDVIVHLAGRAHVTAERDPDPTAAYYRDNVELTRQLAEAAHASGVRRFIFVSSIGVNGPSTNGRPFRETDEPRPTELYARSKLAAELALRKVAARSALEFVIIRPPLVYGPGAKGNLRRMMRLVSTGLPLPLASIKNRRNLVSLANLCDALERCIDSERAANEVFLIAEPEVHSTPEIFAALYAGLGRRNRLFSLPEASLRAAAALLGVGSQYEKLCGSLEIDPTRALTVLGWRPVQSFSDGMALAMRSFLEGEGKGNG